MNTQELVAPLVLQEAPVLGQSRARTVSMAVRFISVILLYQRLLTCARHCIRRLRERYKDSSYRFTESGIQWERYMDLLHSFSPLVLRWN